MSDNETNTHNIENVVYVSDISTDARSLARIADRLPEGRHVILLEKRRGGWHIEAAEVRQTKETGE